MYFIIDANNLAGRMKLGGAHLWQDELIGIIKERTAGKKWRLVLVFDGQDRFGDKYEDGRITVIEAPREEGVQAADEKIKEIIKKDMKNGEWRARDYHLITDDAELKEAVAIIADKHGAKIIFAGIEEFLEKIKYFGGKPETDNEDGEADDKDLGEAQIKTINDELLRLWK
jgi:hypothetical protein